jgi:nitrate/nitrite transporter NarK
MQILTGRQLGESSVKKLCFTRYGVAEIFIHLGEIGALLGGSLADRIGRTKVIFWGALYKD